MVFREYDSSTFNSRINKCSTQKQYIMLVTGMDGIVKQIVNKAVKYHNKGNFTRQRVVINPQKNPDFAKTREFMDDISQLYYFSNAFDMIRAKSYDLDKKKTVFNLINHSQARCNKAISTLLAIINNQTQAHLPKQLTQYVDDTIKFCVDYLELASTFKFTLPHTNSELDTTFSTFIMLSNVIASRNFIIPDITVCITAHANMGNPIYKLSIPPTPFSELKNEVIIENKQGLLNDVKQNLEDIVQLRLTKQIKPQNNPIKKLSNILDTYIDKGSLFVHLNSGTPASQINSLIVRIISLIHEITGVESSRSHVLHKIYLDENQHRVIEFVLQDTSEINEKPVRNLTKMLSMSKDNAEKLIKAVTG